MYRKKIVAGNWKMNTTLSEGIKLVSEIKDLLTQSPVNDVSIIVAPPYTHLQKIVELTSPSGSPHRGERDNLPTGQAGAQNTQLPKGGKHLCCRPELLS